MKRKIIRGYHAPYVTKSLRKAIMTALQNRFHKARTKENERIYKKHRNYCSWLYKKERKKYYNSLNIKEVTDNKKFWKTVKPFFTDKSKGGDNIILVENENIISEDNDVSET